jgi:putative SOS response-associated peptidase YedK
MCGRYTLKTRADIIAETFGVQVPPVLSERFNIAPSQLVLAVRERPPGPQRELVALHWGLIPFWADRMPVVIPPESFEVWLDPAEHDVGKLSRLLRPFHPDEMTAYPVSTLVNNARVDKAECVELLKETG